MAMIAEFTLESAEFPLGTVFEEHPNVTVQLERIVPDSNRTAPYFWVRGAETDDFVAQFPHHPGVRDVQLVDRLENEYLLRCRWVSEYDTILDAIDAPGVVLRSAVGTSEKWTFELRGESRERVAEFKQQCHGRDVSVTLTCLHPLESRESRYDLTEKQRKALVRAYEFGYFNSPRETPLDAVADEFGISQQALASRLRRGNRRLIEQSLIERRLIE